MRVLKVKVISLPYIFQVLCFSRPRYQVSVHRTIGPLVTFTYHNDPKFSDRLVWANSADPDQTAPRGAV